MIPRINARKLPSMGQIRSVQTQPKRSQRLYSPTNHQDAVIMQVSIT